MAFNANVNNIQIPLQQNRQSCATYSLVGMLNHVSGVNLVPNNVANPEGLDNQELNAQVQIIRNDLNANQNNPNNQIAINVLNRWNILLAPGNQIGAESFNGIIDPLNPNGSYYFSILAINQMGGHWTTAEVIINNNNVTINYFDSANGGRQRNMTRDFYEINFRNVLLDYLNMGNANANLNNANLNNANANNANLNNANANNANLNNANLNNANLNNANAIANANQNNVNMNFNNLQVLNNMFPNLNNQFLLNNLINNNGNLQNAINQIYNYINENNMIIQNNMNPPNNMNPDNINFINDMNPPNNMNPDNINFINDMNPPNNINPDNINNLDQNIIQLAGMFPNLDNEQIRNYLVANNNNVNQAAIAILNIIGGGSKKNRYKIKY